MWLALLGELVPCRPGAPRSRRARAARTPQDRATQGLLGPPGGFLEEGELPLDGLRREFLEETGLAVEPLAWVGAFVDPYEAVFVLGLTWIVAAEGEPVAADDVEELAWFAPDELPAEMAFASQHSALARWAERAADRRPAGATASESERSDAPPPRAPRIGCGVAPAVLVIDFARGWTDPLSAFSLTLDSQLESTARLLAAARAAAVPVIYTTVAYDRDDPGAVPMLRKTPRVAALQRGSWQCEIDARVRPGDDDIVLIKKHASAFFGTSLASLLATRGIDTLLIAGCITSGCVRATAVDAAQHGLRALVVEDAVADRSPEQHASSLRSIDALYGDVVTLREALASLAAVSTP